MGTPTDTGDGPAARGPLAPLLAGSSLKLAMLAALALSFAPVGVAAWAALWAAHIACAVLLHSGGRDGPDGAPARPLPPLAGGALALAAVLLLEWAAPVWLCLLSGLTFSRLLFSEGVARFVSELFALLFMCVVASLLMVPGLHLAPASAQALREVSAAPLAVMWAFIALVEASAAASRAPSGRDSDHVSTLLFALTMGFFLLLAVTIDNSSGLGYHESVAAALGIGIALALALTLAWAPFAKWGLGSMVARHLFPTDVSLEKWAQRMSELAMISEDAEQFIAKAAEDLREVARLDLVEWRDGASGKSTAGRPARHRASHRIGPLVLTLHSRRRLSHIRRMMDHFRVEIMMHFYLSKRRETRYASERSSLRDQETGLRLSHDIRNILHSVKAISGLAKTSKDEKLLSLVRNQLPEIGRRLEDALKMIDQPELERERASARISALLWWGRTTRRFESLADGFELDEGLDDSDTVPAGLFDRAAENFVSNALKKRRDGAPVGITLALRKSRGGRPGLVVTDTGARVPPQVARDLFHKPVDSADGTGIGLFDLHGEARALGHSVRLERNVDGQVSFSMRPSS